MNMRVLGVVAAVSAAITGSVAFAADKPDLVPRYTPHEQTAEERLQTFTPPGPPPKEYPNFEDGRLNLDKNNSLGGKLIPEGGVGDVRTTY